jgi:hypothetical protein
MLWTAPSSFGSAQSSSLTGVSRQSRDVELEPGLVHVIHRQQHLDGMIAGREHRAVLHEKVTLVGSDQEYLPPAFTVGARIVRAFQIGL